MASIEPTEAGGARVRWRGRTSGNARSRSFKTLAEAEAFAESLKADIAICKRCAEVLDRAVPDWRTLIENHSQYESPPF